MKVQVFALFSEAAKVVINRLFTAPRGLDDIIDSGPFVTIFDKFINRA